MLVSATQIQAVLAILAGILILIKPEVLNYIIAIYLILIGILALVCMWMASSPFSPMGKAGVEAGKTRKRDAGASRPAGIPPPERWSRRIDLFPRSKCIAGWN